MPLLLKGSVNGEDYNHPVSVKKYAEVVGLMELVERPSINFRSTRIKPDKVNGGVKHPESVSLPTIFSAVTSSGDSIQVQYYDRVVRKGTGNNQFDDYMPKKTSQTNMPLIGKETVINSLDYLEIALFYATHPKCKSSPFHKEGSPHYYEVIFPEKVAEQKAHNMQRLVKMQSTIFEMEESLLRMAAKGMRLRVNNKEHRIHNVDSLSIPELQVKMVELSSRDLDQFSAQFNSGEYKVYGFLNDAMDKGVIKLSAPHSQGRSYEWGVGDGGVIVIVPHGHNPLQVLQKHFITNMASMIPKIQEHLEKKEIDKLVASDSVIKQFDQLLQGSKKGAESHITEENSPTEIFDELFKYGLIGYDPDEKKVVLINKDNTYVKQSFVANVEETHWRAKSIERLKTNRVFLKKAITHLKNNI